MPWKQLSTYMNMNPRSLANLRPWLPGQSPNPGGRPKDRNLVDHILRETHGGEELGQMLLDIARNVRYKAADRTHAIEVMLDRLFGRTVPSDRAGLLDDADLPAQRINFHVILGPDRGEAVEIQAAPEVEDVRETNYTDSAIEAGADATTPNDIEAVDGDTPDSPALDAPVSEDRRA